MVFDGRVLILGMGRSVQSQQVQMQKSYFKAKKCEELTYNEVYISLSPKTVEDAATFLNQFRKLPGKHIPKDCFEYAVEEYKSLCALREAVNLIALLKDAEKEESEEDIISLNRQIKSAMDQMGQVERDLIERVMHSPQRDDRLKQFVQSLYNYSQESSAQYQKQVEETLRKESEDEQEFQSIMGKLYEAVKSIEWSRGVVQTLTSAKKVYEDERRQKQDSIMRLKEELEAIHQKYLEKYKALCSLLPQDGNEQQGIEVEEVKEERQNDYLFNKIQNFLRDMNQPSKQAQILIELDQSIKDFLTKADLPEEVIRLIAKSDSLKVKIQRVLESSSKIMQEKLQQLEREKTAYRILKQQWQVSSQKNKALVADMQSLKKNYDDLKREKGQLISRNEQIQAHNAELKGTNQSLFDKSAEKDQAIDRERRLFQDRLKEAEERNQQKFDQQRTVLQGKLREAQERLEEQQKQLNANLIIRPKLPQKIEHSLINERGSIFSNLSNTLKDTSLLNQLNQLLWDRHKITSASLLYRSDPRNKASIHQYIDNRRNILFVAKTDKLFLGVFSSHAISRRGKGVGSESFLFCFKDYNLNVFPLIEGKEAFEYNKDALIFGDSELCIDVGPLTISSNLGQEGCHYQVEGMDLSFLLQQGRELHLQSFEAYQLLTQGEQARVEVEQEEQGENHEEEPIIKQQLLMTNHQLAILEQQLIDKGLEIAFLKSTIENMHMAQNQQLLPVVPQRDYNIYFPNDILQGKQHKKQFIISAVEEEEGREVSWTRLLYRWDPLNKTNFHKYIDEVPHLLLLLRLKNGRIVAGYSNHPIVFGCKGGDNGLLLSVTTQQIFKLRSPNKAIFYDEYYIIFGNSELRVKSGQALVYSNFGISNSYFDCGQLTVDALFGEGKEGKELPIDGYEIYQLMFSS